ncbi:MAG: N-acyl-D-amino-acid deacylase family protein [Candidatus Saccharibacteria bacterium]
MYDILIKNGMVIDGTGAAAFKADVLIQKGVVAEIAPNIKANAIDEVIDATGKFVTPGFIDIQNHSDSYWTLFEQPDQVSLLSQGITSIIIGNCGASLAPLASAESIKAIQKWHNLSGININWTSVRELLSAIEKIKPGVNVGTLVGHATLRRGLLGDQIRATTADEIAIMNRMLSESLSEGALGFSMGLVYAHEVNSTEAELASLCSALKKNDKYLSIHLRSEDGGILEAVDEAIHLAEQNQVRVKISHLKVRGSKNWHQFEWIINKLENAYHRGLDVTFDVYPYHSTWSVLYTYLPKWSYEGGRSQILRRIGSKEDRPKLLEALREQAYNYDNIKIASAPGAEHLVGRTIPHVAIGQAVTNEQALLNILTATSCQAIVYDHNLDTDQVELLLASPLSVIATDGAGYSNETADLIHPRCFGTMGRFLSQVREKKLMTWEQAIRKITGEPARILKIDRGTLRKGAPADVVVMDPATVRDMADYDHPYQLTEGIASVILNGRVAFQNRKPAGEYGEILIR